MNKSISASAVGSEQALAPVLLNKHPYSANIRIRLCLYVAEEAWNEPTYIRRVEHQSNISASQFYYPIRKLSS